MTAFRPVSEAARSWSDDNVGWAGSRKGVVVVVVVVFDHLMFVAQLLQDIADSGASAFYAGDVADEIVTKVSLTADLYCNGIL